MSSEERWIFHTGVYAFRRVYLGIPDWVQTWEGDREGNYFDAAMVDRTTERLRREQAAKAENYRVAREQRRQSYQPYAKYPPHVPMPHPEEDDKSWGRRIFEAWALANGWINFEAAEQGDPKALSKAMIWAMGTSFKRMPLKPSEQMAPEDKERIRAESIARAEADELTLDPIAANLGVTATESKDL